MWPTRWIDFGQKGSYTAPPQTTGWPNAKMASCCTSRLWVSTSDCCLTGWNCGTHSQSWLSSSTRSSNPRWKYPISSKSSSVSSWSSFPRKSSRTCPNPSVTPSTRHGSKLWNWTSILGKQLKETLWQWTIGGRTNLKLLRLPFTELLFALASRLARSSQAKTRTSWKWWQWPWLWPPRDLQHGQYFCFYEGGISSFLKIGA